MEKIIGSVKKLCENSQDIPFGIRRYNLKDWLSKDEDMEGDIYNWNKLVGIIQRAFVTGQLPKSTVRQLLVLFPKGVGDYIGIGLLEVVWKQIAVIINARIKATINFHDTLHSFQYRSSTGTSTIGGKLFQQMEKIQLLKCQIGAINGCKSLAVNLTSLIKFYFAYCCIR